MNAKEARAKAFEYGNDRLVGSILDAAEARTREMIEEAMADVTRVLAEMRTTCDEMRKTLKEETTARTAEPKCAQCSHAFAEHARRVVLGNLFTACADDDCSCEEYLMPAPPDTPPPFKPGDPVWWRTTMGAESTATVTSDPWHDSIGWIVRIRHELNDEFAIYTSRLRPRTVDAPAVAPPSSESSTSELAFLHVFWRSRFPGGMTPHELLARVKDYGDRRAAEALQAAVRELDACHGAHVRGTYADGFATAVAALRAIAARGGK